MILPRLRLECLESRDVPATFGTPWPDGEHLTLSFAPDGTPIDGETSNLIATLDSLGPDAQFQILRAFEMWAAQANVNIGLVSDNGAAFGTGGVMQGDPRFGDIRVGGRALSSDVLTITAPYNLYDNYSGDVVVNTAQSFGSNGYDLYTALLQEAGHSLGIGNSSDPASVMYEYYLGTRTGLSAGDIASIQSLYGTRQVDTYEGTHGNNTLTTATTYPVLSGPITADLTTANDVDVYKFTAGLLTNSVTVKLTAAGLSLLTSRVELLDSAGHVLASASATDPTHNDLTLSLRSVRAGQTYYVRVSAAGSDFAVGSYGLEVKQSSLLTTVTGLVNNLLNETGLNDTLITATRLLSQTLAVSPQTEYRTEAAFGSSQDVDYYQITVPPSGTTVNMLVTVWGQGGMSLNPWMQVTDAFGHTMSADVITADGNTTTIQIRGLQAGQTYFIKTFSDTHSVGQYTLAADLRIDEVAVPELNSGTVSESTSPALATFELTQSGQVHLVLAATGTGGTAEATITNAAGVVVGRFSANAGRGRSLDIVLPAGTYSVSVSSTSGSSLGFRLGLAIVTDPIGVQPIDPTTNPVPTTPPPPPPPLPLPPPSPPPPPTDTATGTPISSDDAPPPSEPQPAPTEPDDPTSAG